MGVGVTAARWGDQLQLEGQKNRTAAPVEHGAGCVVLVGKSSTAFASANRMQGER
jgi:hypothetical protein